MKSFLFLIPLLVSFNSFAANPDYSCLKDSTFTSSYNSDGSVNAKDKKGHVKFDLMAGGKYAFLSGVGPNNLTIAKEFFMVFKYNLSVDEFISTDGNIWLDVDCENDYIDMHDPSMNAKDVEFTKIK